MAANSFASALVLLLAGGSAAFSITTPLPRAIGAARSRPTINMAGWNDPYDTTSKREVLKTEKDSFDDKMAAQGAGMTNSLAIVTVVCSAIFLFALSQVL